MQVIDQVTHLHEGSTPPIGSRMLDQIAQSKQGRASAEQWLATFKALTQKGVKLIELQESGALEYLEGLPPKEVISREDLITALRRRYYTVKEVLLGSPKYPSWRQPGGSYREYLYIANSERDNFEDALEMVNWLMEELAFNPQRILEDPSLVMKLEKRREELLSQRSNAIEFAHHHFSDKVEGKLGKNLLAHCRVSIHGPTYFIDEIQSDWAQKGRKSGWKNIVRGPLVTQTEAWAGMVLRRQLQIAASMPHIEQVAWITESMRNGGRQNLKAEADKIALRNAYQTFVAEESERRLQAIGSAAMSPEQLAAARELVKPAVAAAAASKGLHEPHDMLNDFYLQVLPKLADKALGKSGARTTIKEFVLDSKVARGHYGTSPVDQENRIKVPCIEITPAARELLVGSQPLYSRAPLRLDRIDLTRREQEIAQAMARAHEMLGSARHLRLAKHVYDVATGRKVAGLYINGMIHVSLHAHDLVEVVEHECVHFAAQHLLQTAEVDMLRNAFANGGALNLQVRQVLRQRGMHAAARQCDDPMEAAAHGFTLWQRQLIEVDTPVRGLFSDLVTLARDCVRWLRRTVLEQRCTSVEEVFHALSSGTLAQDENDHEAGPSRPERQRVMG